MAFVRPINFIFLYILFNSTLLLRNIQGKNYFYDHPSNELKTLEDTSAQVDSKAVTTGMESIN